MSNQDEILMTQQQYEQLKKEVIHFQSELFLWQKGLQNLIFEFEKIGRIMKWHTTEMLNQEPKDQ